MLDSMSKSSRPLLAWALALFVLTSIAGLGVRPLAVPDEARYGAIASEMVERQDWIALRLGGFHWLEKPPLAIWGIAACTTALGENAFAIRLPSVLGMLLGALAAGWVAARATRKPELLAATIAVQATMVGPLIFGTVAITDGAFAGMLSLTMAAWFGACTTRGSRRIGWLVTAGVAAGLAFLCKGFLAFAIPAAVGAAHLLWQRRWRELLVLPWIPIVFAGLVVTPWAIAIHQREPRFWQFFIEYVHLKRALRPDGIHHPEPWWLYLAILPPLGLFWSLLWPKAAVALRSAGAATDGIRFCIAWLVLPMVILSASSGKLPTYTLPLFPPLSALIAIGLMRAHEQGRITVGIPERVARGLLMLAALAALTLAVTGTKPTPIPELWNNAPAARWIVVSVALAAWAWVDRWSWSARDSAGWLLRTAAAPALALACVPWLFPDAIVRGTRNPWALLSKAHAQLASADCVISTSPLAHAAIWSTRRRDIMVTGWPGEFDGGMQPDEDTARLIPTDRLAQTIEQRLAQSRGESVALLAPSVDGTIDAVRGLPEPNRRFEHDGVTVLVWTAP
jgi:4-amino-4-deoxy-L-arabinose transferase